MRITHRSITRLQPPRVADAHMPRIAGRHRVTGSETPHNQAQATPAAAVVLVVEDEALLRMHAVDFIEAAGYRVLEAADTDTAIAIIEANPAIRVVLTDIDLPGSMDGLRLAAAIRRRWPPIELIVTSGAVTPAAGELPERGVFVPKPLDPRRVLSAIDGFIGLA